MTILLKHTIQKPSLFTWATEASKALFHILQKVFQNKFNLPPPFGGIEGGRTEQSFLVPFKEIKANDWDLSINRYKEIVYNEVEYDAPYIIIDRINKLSSERVGLFSKINLN